MMYMVMIAAGYEVYGYEVYLITAEGALEDAGQPRAAGYEHQEQ